MRLIYTIFFSTNCKMGQNNHAPMNLQDIQKYKRQITKKLISYCNDNDLKNKHGIVTLIQEFSEMSYAKYMSGCMVTRGTRRKASVNPAGSVEQTKTDYCVFVVYFVGVIGCVLIYHNHSDFERMVFDLDVDEQERKCTSQFISFYQMLYYIKILFLNSPSTSMNFTRGISNAVGENSLRLLLKHTSIVKDIASDKCFNGTATRIFSMAWGKVSMTIPVVCSPQSNNLHNALKYHTRKQVSILSKDTDGGIVSLLQRLSSSCENAQGLSTWTADAITMSTAYFMIRKRALGLDPRSVILDRGDIIRAENMGLIEASLLYDCSCSKYDCKDSIHHHNRYSRMRVSELKEELRKRGQDITGKKAALVQRLVSSCFEASKAVSIRQGKRKHHEIFFSWHPHGILMASSWQACSGTMLRNYQ